jgi:hypothetical protein
MCSAIAWNRYVQFDLSGREINKDFSTLLEYKYYRSTEHTGSFHFAHNNTIEQLFPWLHTRAYNNTYNELL